MRRGFLVVALFLVFCTGCAVYWGGEQGSQAPLAEPDPGDIPLPPDQSEEFADYSVFAAATDNRLPETMRATDMGKTGLPVDVGTIPLRTIAAQGIQAVVENHFRTPLPDERPAFTLEASPQYLSVRQDGQSARAKIAIRITCTKQDATRTKLLSETYWAESDSPWIKSTVPIALYDAFNKIWTDFLHDFRQNVGPATLLGKETLPELLAFETQRGDTSVSTGRCLLASNGWEAFQAASWAKKQILKRCVEQLGVEKQRVRIRFDDELTKYDRNTRTWNFVFSFWARTRMALQYDPAWRRGYAIVDLGLFEGTAEEAAQAAKEYIVREMNLRSATYADDKTGATADIVFLAFKTEVEDELLVVNFRLVY